MNKLIFLILLLFTSCTTTQYRTIPLTQPPEFYTPDRNIKNQRDFLKEYQNSLKHIKRWQYWYDVQVGSNYFYTN